MSGERSVGRASISPILPDDTQPRRRRAAPASAAAIAEPAPETGPRGLAHFTAQRPSHREILAYLHQNLLGTTALPGDDLAADARASAAFGARVRQALGVARDYAPGWWRNSWEHTNLRMDGSLLQDEEFMQIVDPPGSGPSDSILQRANDGLKQLEEIFSDPPEGAEITQAEHDLLAGFRSYIAPRIAQARKDLQPLLNPDGSGRAKLTRGLYYGLTELAVVGLVMANALKQEPPAIVLSILAIAFFSRSPQKTWSFAQNPHAALPLYLRKFQQGNLLWIWPVVAFGAASISKAAARALNFEPKAELPWLIFATLGEFALFEISDHFTEIKDWPGWPGKAAAPAAPLPETFGGRVPLIGPLPEGEARPLVPRYTRAEVERLFEQVAESFNALSEEQERFTRQTPHLRPGPKYLINKRLSNDTSSQLRFAKQNGQRALNAVRQALAAVPAGVRQISNTDAAEKLGYMILGDVLALVAAGFNFPSKLSISDFVAYLLYLLHVYWQAYRNAAVMTQDMANLFIGMSSSSEVGLPANVADLLGTVGIIPNEFEFTKRDALPIALFTLFTTLMFLTVLPKTAEYSAKWVGGGIGKAGGKLGEGAVLLKDETVKRFRDFAGPIQRQATATFHLAAAMGRQPPQPDLEMQRSALQIARNNRGRSAAERLVEALEAAPLPIQPLDPGFRDMVRARARADREENQLHGQPAHVQLAYDQVVDRYIDVAEGRRSAERFCASIDIDAMHNEPLQPGFASEIRHLAEPGLADRSADFTAAFEEQLGRAIETVEGRFAADRHIAGISFASVRSAPLATGYPAQMVELADKALRQNHAGRPAPFAAAYRGRIEEGIELIRAQAAAELFRRDMIRQAVADRQPAGERRAAIEAQATDLLQRTYPEASPVFSAEFMAQVSALIGRSLDGEEASPAASEERES